ncbi:putative amino-acid acetyltransferase [Streptococcus sp. DD11]|nr:putative amino-acid acetyltransferase [Streptococcus sp. DD11]
MAAADYPALCQLWLSCAGMGLNNLDDSEEGIVRFLQRNPDTCLVAVEGDRLIGAILVGTDGCRAYIYHTAVAPDCRRRGIAKALVEQALEAVKSLGLHKVSLVVFEGNAAGNQFWEALGFGLREDLLYRDKPLRDMVRIDT